MRNNDGIKEYNNIVGIIRQGKIEKAFQLIRDNKHQGELNTRALYKILDYKTKK